MLFGLILVAVRQVLDVLGNLFSLKISLALFASSVKPYFALGTMKRPVSRIGCQGTRSSMKTTPPRAKSGKMEGLGLAGITYQVFPPPTASIKVLEVQCGMGHLSPSANSFSRIIAMLIDIPGRSPLRPEIVST